MQCAITKSDDDGGGVDISIKVTSIDGLAVKFDLPSKMSKSDAANLIASIATGFETKYVEYV